MDLVGKDILTRTILARDEDRCIGGSHFIQLLVDSGHGWAGAPVHFGRLAIGYGRWGRRFLACAFNFLLVRKGKSLNEFVIVPRLDDEIESSAFHTLYCELNIAVGGEEHHFDIRCKLFDFGEPV